MRFCWFALIVLFLVGCGQPLQLNTSRTAQPPVRPAPQSSPQATPLAESGAATATAPAAATPAPAQPTLIPPTVAAPKATQESTLPTVIVIPQTAVPLTNEQRWRAQQLERHVFDPPRIYIVNENLPLMWYDPTTGQSLEIGVVRGELPVQAEFVLRMDQHPALEVPYRINVDFGLTAISGAVRDRMMAAGFTETVEAYIERTEAVVAK